MSTPCRPAKSSKSLESAAEIYDWLIDHQAERGHAVVARGWRRRD